MPKSANTADEYDFVDHQDTALDPEVVAQLREWLQPTDYLAESGEFRRHLLSQAPGTGLWICQTEEYRMWHDSPDHGSLWIKGAPGAGKSVMAASLIQHLRVTENCPVLFFFFRNIVAANFSPRALIQDWLAQLLPYSPKLQFALQTWQLTTSLEETLDSDLIQIFLDGVSCAPKLYCIGDALDEMSTDSRPFLEKLNSLATHRPRTLKLLLTSRPKQYLQSTIRDSSIVHVSLQQRLVDADILAYLNHRFDTLPKSNSQCRLKQDVIDMVAQKSESLFLYAKLTMDQLEESLQSDNAIDIAALETPLPIGLEQTYTRMLAKQRLESEITTGVQLLVLEAVTHASRPLRLNELAGLLECVYPTLAQPGTFKSLIATSCGPLIEILEDETLQVIHHSFTEFLRGENRSTLAAEVFPFPIINSPQAHRHMAINCLRYLQAGSMMLEAEKSGAVLLNSTMTFTSHRNACEDSRRVPHRSHIKQSDPFDYRAARLLHPFLSYAVENWSYHASFYDVVDEDFFEAIISFVNPDSLPFLRWLVIKWGTTSVDRGSSGGTPTPLHLAAFAGLSELASKLLQRNASVSALDALERTPLHWAAANGHFKIASLLIQYGAYPDTDDRTGLKPIHLATLRDRAEVVKLLLQNGVKPDTPKTKEDRPDRRCCAKSTKGETALTYASRAGCVDIVLALAPFCDEDMLGEMLCLLCSRNRTEAVLALLDNSTVSPNATYQDATALYHACSGPSFKCAEGLISRGANVNKMSKLWRDTEATWEIDMAPIHRLVQVWNDPNDMECRKTLKILLKAGAVIDQLNGYGRTALLEAASYSKGPYNRSGHCFPSVKALIDEGADVKAVNPPLSYCVTTNEPELCSSGVLHSVARKSRDLEMMKLLLELGCDLNEKDGRGQTALLCAMDPTRRNHRVESESKTLAIIEYLLDQGANPSCQDDDGNSPLSFAMSLGASIFRLLFSKCQDMEEKKRCWFSLSKLRLRHRDKFTQCLRMFLSEGFDIETRDEDGKTLFLHCCSQGPRERTKILLNHGAHPNVKDDEGNNALLLSCLSLNNDWEVLRQLIAAGASPLETNNDGNTVLHLIAKCYDMKQKLADFVCHLIDLGVPVNATNNNGSTPLHLYQERDGEYYVRDKSKRYHFIDVLNNQHGLDFEVLNNQGLAAFHIAATKSEAEVARIIGCGVDVNLRTTHSKNALHLACEARRPNITGQLLMRGIDFDHQDDLGRTPLYYACRSGDAESVEWLLRYGASPDLKASDGSTALHACADYAYEDHSNIPRPWYLHEPHRPPPMASKTHPFPAITEIVESLIRAGVDVGCCDKNGLTALDVALFTGCTGFVEIFYQSESLLEEATKNLETIGRGLESVDTLRQRIRLQMSLMLPRPYLEFLHMDDPKLEMLLESPGISLGLLSTNETILLVNKSFGTNPTSGSLYRVLAQLMQPDTTQKINRSKVIENSSELISFYSKYEGVKARLEAIKSEPSFCGDTPKTALGIACSQRESNFVTVKTLVEKLQVDINARFACFRAADRKPPFEIVPGGTALHVLASVEGYWQLEALKYLLVHGADVNAIDEGGNTPLHVASMGLQYGREGLWRLEAVKILLDHGADVTILDSEGLSVLHKASFTPDIIRELLSCGMDANIGIKSPLFACIRDQNLKTLKLLLKHGAKPDAVDKTCHSTDVDMALKRPRSVCPLLFSAFAVPDRFSTLNDLADSVPLLVELVTHGADIYLPLNDDETLIHFLFEYPEYNIIEALMEEPCVSRIDFNRRDQRGRTVLIAACSFRRDLPGYSRSSRRFSPRMGPPSNILSHGADASLVDSSGKTALHYLLSNPGYPDDVLIDFINREEVSPTILLKDGEGYSPLHHAFGTIRPAVCEALLTKGADLLEPDPQGRTALHYIASQCLLLERKPVDPWHWYHELGENFFDGCMSLWQKYLSQGGSINAVDNAGNTPLHTYLSMLDPCVDEDNWGVCHVDHYEALFSENRGVDVFAVNKAGETVLHKIASRPYSTYLVEWHDKALFTMMMDKGLDPLKEDVKGRSALDVASACEKEDIVGLLSRK